MTTENLTGLDALVDANRVVADSARSRGRQLETEANGERHAHEDRMANHAIAGRALVQQHRDVMSELDHEAAQIAFVLNGDPTPAPAPAPTPAPVAPVQPEPQQNGGNNNDPGNPPTAVVPVVPVVQPEPQRQSPLRNLNPRQWNGLAWLLAILGLFVGLIVARVTYDPMWSDVHNGFWHGLLVTLWFVALAAAGFFTGGWIGATIEENQRNNRNTPAAA